VKTKPLAIDELTRETFAPYGSVIRHPASEADASGEGWRWWSEVAQVPSSETPYTVGFLALEPADLSFDWAEYHLQSKETIIPLGEECLVYVGAPGAEPDWERFQVFRIRKGQGVILDEGVWHGAPLATSGSLSALVLLRQGTGDHDTYKADHPGGPIGILEGP
jgi:ureidoglycolate hydrolase